MSFKRLIVFLSLCTISWATNFYVSPTGSDTNTGTLASPWATIGKADSVAVGGDVVHVLPGTYNISSNINTTHSGTSGNRIRFISEIKWGAKIINSATGNGDIWISRGDWVEISGFDMDGNGYYGITVQGSNVQILNNIVHDIPASASGCSAGAGILGYFVKSDNVTRTANIDIIGNIVHHIGDPNSACTQTHGIYQTTNGGRVSNNIVYHTRGWGLHFWHGPTNIICSHNLIFDNGQAAMVLGSDGGSDPAAANNTISNNIFLNNGYSYSTAAAGKEQGTVGSGNIWRNNIVFGNKVNSIVVVGSDTSTGVVTSDPQLATYGTGAWGTQELHLKSTSPAIGGGTSTGSYTVDIDGVTRPQGTAYDIGPYEFVTIGTSTNYPKTSATSKTTQTANNTSTPGWAEGVAPTWTGCSGYHCLITTKGLTACDGTTTSPTFCETTVPRPANISGVDDGVSLHDLLYPGATTRIQVHYQGWFCPTGTRCNGHINLGVLSNSTAQVTKELQEMHDIGVRGVQHYWQGRPYGSASYPSICASTNQKQKCYLDESTQKVRDAIENTAAFQDMDYSVVYSTEANNDCDASPSPTNCGDGTAASCGYVNDIANDDTKQHCSNAANTLCSVNTDCPTGGSCVWDGCTSNDKAVVDLNWLDTQLFNHPRYQKDAGRPVVYLFGFSNSGQNWSAIRAALTSNPKIISRFNNGSNPMTESNFDGGWGWQGRPSSDCYGYTTTFAGGPAESTGCGTETCPAHGTDIYACASTRAQSAPTKFYAEGLHSQHDNRSTPWAAPNGGSAPIKINPPFCGTTLIKAYNILNSKWSSANQVAYATQITWDDVDESSSVKTGIESCWRFQAGSPYLTGNILNWVIEKYDTDGSGPQVAADASTTTLDHFRIFVSGAAITPAAFTGDAMFEAATKSISSGTCTGNTCTYSYDLSTLGLNGGLHYINVKLVGKALVQTKFSSIVYYLGTGGSPAPNNPPLVSLTLSPISGVVPVLTTGTLSATDSDGTITLATINWGDGTIDTVTGLTSKTHTYTVSGTYTVTYSATDNSAAVSNTAKTFTASDPTPPPPNIPPVVALSLSPTSGTVPVGTTATLTATDSDGTISLATLNWGDGTTDTVTGLASKVHTYTVNGNYTVTYSARDNSGDSSTITAPFTASASPPPANIPPVVTMTISPASGVVPILTTATLSATDSDGTVSSTFVNWGDGTTDITTGLGSKAHTYLVPGAYMVVYSATDNSGDTSTVSKPFTASGTLLRKHRPREN